MVIRLSLSMIIRMVFGILDMSGMSFEVAVGIGASILTDITKAISQEKKCRS